MKEEVGEEKIKMRRKGEEEEKRSVNIQYIQEGRRKRRDEEKEAKRGSWGRRMMRRVERERKR